MQDDTKTPSYSKRSFLTRLKNDLQSIRMKKASKKQWIIGGAIAVLLIAGGIFAAIKIREYYKLPPTKETPVVKQVEKPKPTTEPSKLTGVEVPIELNKRPVTGVMIENSPDARPQAGLKDAGVMIEAIAEGGITRFLALYQEAQPDYIGPVRSVRPYYLDYLLGFDASVAHAGGSGQALGDIKALGVKDLDQFANSGAYKRVSNRFAPHNLYTSMAGLDNLNNAKGYTSSTFTSLARKADTPAATPTANKIDLTISSVLYNPHYDYYPTTNSYLRSEGGKPHLDERSGLQLNPKVVVVLAVPFSQSGIYSVYQTTGRGQAFVFQDGAVQEATWSKAGRKDSLHLLGPDGKDLPLNAGQTWISLVKTAGSVSYTP